MKIEKIRFVATYNLLYNIHVFFVIRNFQSFVYINIVLLFLGGICNEGRALQQGWARGLRAKAKTCLGLVQTLEVTAWEIAHLESCHLEKVPLLAWHSLLLQIGV